MSKVAVKTIKHNRGFKKHVVTIELKNSSYRAHRVFASIAGLALVLSLALPSAVGAATIADNKVGIALEGFVLSGSYSSVADQPTGIGQIKNGNVGAYPEGSCIPIEIEVKNKDNIAGDINVAPVFDYFNTVVGLDHLEKITTSLSGNPADNADDLNDFAYTGNQLTSITSFAASSGTVNATITGPFTGDTTGTGAVTATDTSRHYNVVLADVPSGATVYMIFCARLGVDASLYNGGSALSVRNSGAAQNVPIPVNQLLALPSLTINKTVSGGTAVASDFSFTLSPDVNGHTGAYTLTNGSVVINNLFPDGNFTITESGSSGYTMSGSGTNCTVTASSATAAVAAGKPATNAVCNITNTFVPTTGTLNVIKQVINDNGGNNVPEDFTIDVTGANASPSSFAGSLNGTSVTVTGGQSYSVSETGPSGYTASYSADCAGSVAVGQTKTCIITHNYNLLGQPTNFDVSVDKSASDTSPDARQSIIYTIVVANSGDATASNVVLSDILPSGVTYVSDDGGPDTAFATNTLTWTVGNLTSGSSTTLHVTVIVNEDTAGDVIINTASVPVNNNDTNSENNSDSATVTVNTPTSLFSLSGKVYNDNNPENGNLDESENGLAGWTVYIDGNNNDTFDAEDIHHTESASDGSYEFTSLPGDCYTVREVLLSGWNQTQPTSVQEFEYFVALGGADCGFNTQVSLLHTITNLFIHTAQAAVNTTQSTDLNFGNVAISNSGGGGVGGGGFPAPPSSGQVLGDTTNVPSIQVPSVTPQVLGATKTLPRTGLSLDFLYFLSSLLGLSFLTAGKKKA